MKRVRINGSHKFVPQKIYLYRSIVHSLTDMVKRPGFLSKCEHWRDRPNVSDQQYLDRYEGKVWKSLNSINGRKFLALPSNLCLGMNVDWFNPYAPYSVGAVYLVVLNLPREERFKFQNVILACMIPGPNEPSGDINSFLAPLVRDLNTLYDGVFIRSPSLVSITNIRAILISVMCDLPATRKVCGYTNFNGLKGCSKCFRVSYS